MGLFSKFFSQKQLIVLDKDQIAQIVEKQIAPSDLSSFGGKTMWVTVRSDSTRLVLEKLELIKLEKVTWKEGISGSYSSDVFITEPVKGWVFLIGWGLPVPLTSGLDEVSEFINKLSIQFGEAHYYLAQRTTDTASWVKSIRGKVKRAYLISDGMSIVTGKPTQIEQEFNLVDLNDPMAKTDKYFENHIYPYLEEVLKISESWSFNPSNINEINSEEIGVGYLATLK